MDAPVGATGKNRLDWLVEEVAERRLQLALNGPGARLELGASETAPVVLENQCQCSTERRFP